MSTDRDKTPKEIQAEARRILHELQMEKKAKQILDQTNRK
jgi:hypothetical protein